MRATLISGEEGVACPVYLAEPEGGCLVLGGLVDTLSCVLLLRTTVVLASWAVQRSPLLLSSRIFFNTEVIALKGGDA